MSVRRVLMKAVVFDRIGAPEDVLYLAEIPVSEIQENEVLVRMVSSSINPGDFLFIRNLYPEPKRPHLPCQIAGNHGAGIVEKAGTKVSITPGTLVAFSYYNAWAEFAVIPSEWIVPLPEGYPPERAAQLMSAITAWDLLADSGVQPGQWLALTAGYSLVSTMVLQLAARQGIHVLPIVRKTYDHPDLRSLGASDVIDLSLLNTALGEEVSQKTGGVGVHALIDNVGGPSTGDLIRSLATGGKVVINGGMTEESFTLHNFDILMKVLEVRASVYRFFFDPPTDADRPSLQTIINLLQDESFVVPIGGVHSLSEFKEAISDTYTKASLGKQLFRLNTPS